MSYDPKGTFALTSFLIGVAVGALIGAAIGAVSYTAGQAVEAAFTGDFEWSWGGFIGATNGGAVSGIISYATAGAGANLAPWLGKLISGGLSFVNGFISTASTMVGENISGDANYSVKDIIQSAGLSGLQSVAFAGLSDKIKIPGLTIGDNSFKTVAENTYKGLRSGALKKISMKTFGKIAALESFNSGVGFVCEQSKYYSLGDRFDWTLG